MSDVVDVIDLFPEDDNGQIWRAGNVLYAADVYVKCWALEAALPIAAKLTGDIDIFELTALQFVNLRRMTLAELSDETCLAEDFLKTIVARLADKDYLKVGGTSMEITAEGRAYLEQKPEDSTEIEYVQFLMLPDTGQLLPLLVPSGKAGGGKKKTGILRGRFLLVDRAESRGKAEERRCPIWVPAGKSDVKDARAYAKGLTQNRLRAFIRQYNQEHAAEQRKLDLKRAITLSLQPHSVYLHAIVLLQRGLVGVPLVVDSPYGNDQTLALYARQYQKESLEAIRRRADEGAARPEKQEDAAGYRHYGNIHALMEPFDEGSAPLSPDENMTEDEKRQYVRQKEDHLKNAYRAVELALSYYIQMYPLTDARQHALQSMNIEENRRYVADVAKQIGFRTGEEVLRLFGQLDRSRIRCYFAKHVANLYTVLPLALASTLDHADGGLWRVACEQPGLLATLACLTQSSQFRHGSAEATLEDNAAYQSYSAIIADVKRFLELLLPGYDEGQSEVVVVENDAAALDASNLLLHAEDVAVSLLGADIYGSLNKNMQDDILAVTAKYNAIDVAPVDFISNLAKILENFYRSEVMAKDHLERKERGDIMSYIQSHVEALAGGAAFPVELSTVRKSKIAAACRGEDATLGAYALVYFGNLSAEELDGASEDIACTAEILRYRRHDNNMQLRLSMNKLKELRQAVFTVIKRRYHSYGN